MKQSLLIMLAAVLIVSCQKDIIPASNDYVETVQRGLKDSLSTVDFKALDFSKASRSVVDNINLYYLRIPFRGKKQNEDFVLVKTNKAGIIVSGRIIHLQGKITSSSIADQEMKSWDGNVSISSLTGKRLLESPIRNGYITALHQQNNYRTESHEAPVHTMQEVIITYVVPSRDGMSWSSWYMFQSLMLDGNGGHDSNGGYYSDFSAGGGSSGTGDSNGGSDDGSSGGGGTNDPVIHVDLENQDLRDGIDIQKFVNCFNTIPDDGATCSIEIATDIPVDKNPNAFYNFTTGSPGHVFITITKKNGTQQTSQNIGFYPTSGYKASTYAPTAGKLVDNQGHEFNATLSMNISPAQLSTALVRMQQLSNLNYDVDSYNCTDWAMDIFNSVRTDKLEIPLYGIPNSPLTQGSRTPQGLYQKLQQMMNNNSPEKGNITIGIIKGYAGGSTGPCN